MSRLTYKVVAVMALALGLVPGAKATTMNLGDVGSTGWTNTGDGNYQYTVTGTAASGAGTLNTYNFDMTKAGSFYSVSLTSTPTSKTGVVKRYSWELLEGSTALASGSSASPTLNIANYVNLTAGDYTLLVTAVSGASNKAANFAGVLDISPVPLPAALPLFGSALFGVGLYGRRRRAKAAVIAA